MLPKPIPALTNEQWDFVAQRLDKPAPTEMQEELRRAIEIAKKIREE